MNINFIPILVVPAVPYKGGDKIPPPRKPDRHRSSNGRHSLEDFELL